VPQTSAALVRLRAAVVRDPVEQAGESLVAGNVDAGEGHVVVQQDGGPSVRATRLP
jgi:hypothetical protein